MVLISFWARVQAKQRKFVYGFISLLVISSMLVQPVLAIAVIHKAERELREAVAGGRASTAAVTVADTKHGTRTTSMYAMDRVRLAAALPKPARRMVAQVNPTPSYAKPIYPYNHILDGSYSAIGSPPTNHDFEAPATGGGTPPANYDFSAAPYAVGTPPTNHDFETGSLAGWATSGTVSIQNDAGHGSWAQLGSSGVVISDPFTVDSAAQRITFWVNHLAASAVRVYVHSDPTYSTRTEVDYLVCSSCGWVEYSINADDYWGQSIKVEFKRFGSGNIGVDDLQMDVLLPEYIATGSFSRIDDGNGNVYAQLAGVSAKITTAPFLINNGVQQLTLLLTGLTTSSDQYQVDILSDPNYATVTKLGSGVVSDSWQAFSYTVSAWQGQSVKLRVSSKYGKIGVDDIAAQIGTQSVVVPGWEVTGGVDVVDEGNGNHYVATTGSLTSEPLTLDSNIQQISLRYRGIGSAIIDRFLVKLLRVDTGEEFTLASNIVASTEWQTLKIGLNKHAGQTVRFQLQQQYGRVHFDDVAKGELILHGWHPTEYDGIATATDGNGSYVTASEGHGFTIRSATIGLGLIDHPSGINARHYAIAFDPGPTGSLLRVYWDRADDDPATPPVQYLQDAGAENGYQERYVRIPQGAGSEGRLVIAMTGGGKLYSVADNVARQHLAEPFSYKIGVKIDTSTGSFGYSALDLQMPELFPLILTRYYNGHSDRPGVLGHGWSHSYETRLVIDEQFGHAGVVFGSGKEVFFHYATSVYTPADPRVRDQLVKHGDGTYTYHAKGAPETPYSTDDGCSFVELRLLQLRPQNFTYHFAADGKLLTLQDSNGITISLTYENERLVSVMSQSGSGFTFSYNGEGKLETVHSPWAGTATYGYQSGDLASVTRSDRGTETYEYWSGYLWRIRDANNRLVADNIFDVVHRVTSQSNAQNDSLTIAYNTPAAGVTAITYPVGGTHYFYYDQYQRTTDWVAPTGEITSYLYDSVGNLDKVIDGGAGEWNFSYDQHANMVGIADPQGDPLIISYNPDYLPTSITDGNGNVTTIQYYADGNVERMISGGEETYYTYTALGQLQTLTTPWRSERYTYYPLDGTIQSGKLHTRSLGAPGAEKSWTYTYELFVHEGYTVGYKEHLTDPNNHTATTIYNTAGRIVALRDHTGAQKEFLYDPVGNLIMAEDELDRRTLWDYNALGLVEKKTDPEQFATLYTYDANGNMATVTDPNGLVTRYEHDESDRLKRSPCPVTVQLSIGTTAVAALPRR